MSSVKPHDKLAARLALILQKLNNGESFTLSELAEEFGVSTRTIQTDLNRRLSFLPIEREAGRYRLAEYCLGKLRFEDLRAFATLSGIRHLYPELSDQFLADLLNSRVNRALRVIPVPYEDPAPDTPIFEQLAGAILNRYTLRYLYKEKPREVHPYKLINNDGIWYLLADEKGQLKLFALSRIKELKGTHDTFEPDPEMQSQADDPKRKWFSAREVTVTLHIDAAVADYFLRRPLLPQQRILQRTPEGLLVETRTHYPETILRLVRQWIPHIDLRTPDSLRKRLREELTGYLETVLYQE